MAVNQVIFDQVYEVLDKVRAELRHNYDTSADERDKTIAFCMKGKKAVRCEEDDNGAVPVTVSWDNNNAGLRTLAREVMHGLTEEK